MTFVQGKDMGVRMTVGRGKAQWPGWIASLMASLDRVTGGGLPHESGVSRAEPPGAPPWDPLPAEAEVDLAVWWAWVGSVPFDAPDHVPLLPVYETALPFGAAWEYAAFTRGIALETLPDEADEFWKVTYVPLTGDADGAFVVDVGQPDLPVYMWWLEAGFEPPEPIGYGVPSLALQMTSLLDAGFFRYDEDERRFVRTRAPLPQGITEEHPLVRWAGAPRD